MLQPCGLHILSNRAFSLDIIRYARILKYTELY